MDKLLTGIFVTLITAALGAQTPPTQTPPTQKPGTQPPAAQAPPPQTQPGKPAAPQTGAQPPAQTPPATKPAPQALPQPAQPAARATALLFVTTVSGAAIVEAKVTLTGPLDREGVTTREGSVRFANLRSGTYRARFDAPDFILFERELTLRAGQMLEMEVVLNPAPAKKVEPPPPPPAPKTVEAPPEPPGEVALLSLPDWLEKNALGRSEPFKESPIGRTPGAAVSVLQVRDAQEAQSHGDADETLYVLAGEGAIRVDGRTQTITPGWIAVVPRGTSYSLERRGRNPLILVSTVAPAKGTSATGR
jgi:mannose-6-phosphate isomerase-like protein (cupin superfamily)